LAFTWAENLNGSWWEKSVFGSDSNR